VGETTQLTKEVEACAQAYHTMVSGFTGIVTPALGIGIEQLPLPLKKIDMLCVTVAAKAGKLSDKA
jgi:hypothetical protein